MPLSAPHISPGRPRSWRTFAFGDEKGRDENVSVAGSKRTSALAVHSVTQTMSASSTNTAYAIGRAPGSFHSFHPLAGSYSPSWPTFHSATQTRLRESHHTRRAPWFGVGGWSTVAPPVARSIRPR